jgi:hypothetical protein
MGIQAKCAQLLSNVDTKEDPADIEDAVMEAIPSSEPMRSEFINTLAKVHATAPSSFDICTHVSSSRQRNTPLSCDVPAPCADDEG